MGKDLEFKTILYLRLLSVVMIRTAITLKYDFKQEVIDT